MQSVKSPLEPVITYIPDITDEEGLLTGFQVLQDLLIPSKIYNAQFRGHRMDPSQPWTLSVKLEDIDYFILLKKEAEKRDFIAARRDFKRANKSQSQMKLSEEFPYKADIRAMKPKALKDEFKKMVDGLPKRRIDQRKCAEIEPRLNQIRMILQFFRPGTELDQIQSMFKEIILNTPIIILQELLLRRCPANILTEIYAETIRKLESNEEVNPNFLALICKYYKIANPDKIEEINVYHPPCPKSECDSINCLFYHETSENRNIICPACGYFGYHHDEFDISRPAIRLRAKENMDFVISPVVHLKNDDLWRKTEESLLYWRTAFEKMNLGDMKFNYFTLNLGDWETPLNCHGQVRVFRTKSHDKSRLKYEIEDCKYFLLKPPHLPKQVTKKPTVVPQQKSSPKPKQNPNPFELPESDD
jgi:hypothetical protein